MNSSNQNKQKSFWTVFAIVVAIFVILLATGVIERGPQPQAAEPTYCLSSCSATQLVEVHELADNQKSKECITALREEIVCSPKKDIKCGKGPDKCYKFTKKEGEEKDKCKNECGEGTECIKESSGGSYICACKDDDQDDDDDQGEKECSDFLNQNLDSKSGRNLCEKSSEKKNLSCTYEHGTCTSDSDEFKSHCGELSNFGKKRCESVVLGDKKTLCKWTESSCTNKKKRWK